MKNFFSKLSKPVRFLLLFLIIPFRLFAQDIAVSGTVTDNNGEALIGVSVVQKGTTRGISTDLDGKYILTVSGDAVLNFSYMGYITQSVPVQGRTRVDVIMQEDTKALQEVVVIGYGVQRREAVTGSVVSMQGDALRQVATGDVATALAGRLPGIQMSATNSQPGSDMQIRIRGTRSLSATNDPLIVLDGIPYGGNLSEINPNDVKSVDILKDASATAIYGSRGANGVIIITTFKGNAGQKPKITYNAYVGAKTLFNRFPMMTGDELYQLRKDAGVYKDTQGNPNMGTDEKLGTNTDWQDLMYGTGMTTSHNLGISGGTEGGSYNVGTGYLKDEALMPEQNYNRISLRANFDQGIGKYFRFGMTTNNNYNIVNGRSLSLVNVLARSPLINPYNEDGTWKPRVSSVNDQGVYNYSRDVIENLGDAFADNGRVFGSYNSLFGEIKIPGVEGLSYRATIGLDYRGFQRGQYRGIGVMSDAATAPSSGSLDKRTHYKWSVENLATYDKYFDKHHLTLNAMYSAEKSHTDRSLVSATDIPDDFIQYWNIGLAPSGNIVYSPENQQFNDLALISYMGRVMYDYDSRYMLMASIRRDGSSVLAAEHKWITYPAFSAGWNISKEAFMQSTEWVDNLKLRLGWGLTSNQSVDPYQTLGSLGTRKYNFGTTTTTGYYVTKSTNPELSWEYTKTWNVGVDFSLLENRLWGTIDYYNSNSYDLIQEVRLPQTAGFPSYYANVGDMTNKGVEIALNGNIINQPDGWRWDLGLNFYTNKNKITKLSEGIDQDSKNQQDLTNYWFVGHPVNVVYDYQKIGLWQEGDQYLTDYEPGGNVGMIKVKYTGEVDANGKPVRAIGPADRQIMSADPDWQGGFNTTVGYKNWDLNILGTYQHGGLLVSSLYSSNGYLNLLSGRRGNVKADYWTPENTGANFPKPGGIQSGDNPKYGSTLGYFDATYFKVGQITLGYNFDSNANWFKKLGLSSARLYFTVQNAFVLFSPFTEESGLDPTTNSYGNENAAVTNDLPYNRSKMLVVSANSPQTRNFIFGLNLSF